MKEKEILYSIKSNFTHGIPEGFTGLGIILVKDNLDDLPVDSLLDEEGLLDTYKTEKDIVTFLISISENKDRRHDGFHIISKTQGLINISQYFSPQIPRNFEDTIYNVGSRYRAAQYGSLYKNVYSIIIVSRFGNISIAKNGNVGQFKK